MNVDGLDWAFHSLGDLYKGQGKLAKAEKMYIQALQGYEEALGPAHTLTLNIAVKVLRHLNKQLTITREKELDTLIGTPTKRREI